MCSLDALSSKAKWKSRKHVAITMAADARFSRFLAAAIDESAFAVIFEHLDTIHGGFPISVSKSRTAYRHTAPASADI
jgi:hypothetical protein